MTYSQQIKNEFCQCKLHCKRCAGALLYGMLLFGKGGEGRTVSFTTENKEAAYLFAHTVIDLTGAIVTVAEPDLRVKNKRPQYSVTVDDENYADTIRRLFWKNGKEDHGWIQPEMVGRECCAMAFLRGAYLACGTMIDPAKEYHLEFAVASESLCDDLIGLVDEYDLDFRKSVRMKKLIVYTKESNQI